ncbi:uncharacterized protein BP01DRAFT_13735 [Aspergillus saccharolyticus JOP 1030-1]|uniref:Uncharacterized protein n=1 Tax=Aspergillus saccharolyticus JOP 1030-1 TaxID=1450539 RepID=A0A318ZTU3_9EURO|nr:hypothetical protein BP01DRAFT_13735 [Aspergillus saccharolyticus JOP 1030-1]PYH50075.1 hypothetical protein BP01DRAFT_13735 [Aspergillus saccharolyticus JOP 1030-1]
MWPRCSDVAVAPQWARRRTTFKTFLLAVQPEDSSAVWLDSEQRHVVLYSTPMRRTEQTDCLPLHSKAGILISIEPLILFALFLFYYHFERLSSLMS